MATVMLHSAKDPI